MHLGNRNMRTVEFDDKVTLVGNVVTFSANFGVEERLGQEFENNLKALVVAI
jgi:hypothetical protein